VPGKRALCTSPDGALVRIAATELNPTASVPVHALGDGIGLGEPCRPSPAPSIAEGIVCLATRGARTCARLNTFADIDMGKGNPVGHCEPYVRS
jgi:hypothetical protein